MVHDSQTILKSLQSIEIISYNTGVIKNSNNTILELGRSSEYFGFRVPKFKLIAIYRTVLYGRQTNTQFVTFGRKLLSSHG